MMQTQCDLCKITFEGTYCHKCGQKKVNYKLTLGRIISDIGSNLFNLERGVFGTYYQLLKNPWLVAENYWNGFRGYYASPGKIVVFTLAIIALHSLLDSNELFGIQLDVDLSVIDPQKFMLIFFLPIQALCSKLIHWKSGRNYLEHLVLSLYILSTIFLVGLIISDILFLIDDEIGFDYAVHIFLLIFPISFFWNARVFNHGKFWKLMLSTCGLILAFLLIMGLTFTIMHFTDFVDLRINESE